jgi:type I restriction enzyme S subunit
VKAGWSTERLDALCTVFADGDWIESKDQSPCGVRLVQTGNVGNGVFKGRSEKARYISEATFDRLRCTELQSGDCLVSRLPDPVGRACLVPELTEKAITAVDCTIIRFKASMVIPEFFVYFSQGTAYAEQVANLTGGATRQRISRKNLGQVVIPLPPLEQQQLIVAVLDDAIAAIATATANAEKNLANARELFASTLATAFDGEAKGWPLVRLGAIGRTLTGNTPKTSNSGNFGNHIPFIKPGDFKPNGSLGYENEALSEEGAKGSRVIPAGSALMVCIGATIGKSGYAEQQVAANQQVNALIPDAGILGKFVFYQFLTNRFQSAVLSASGQATLPIINKSKWTDLEIYMPDSEDEQYATVKLLDGLMLEREALETAYAAKIVTLARLKQCILHRAFAGELTATMPETIAA